MTTRTTAATATSVRDPAGYDDDALDRLADLLAERLAVRLSGLAPALPEPLVDAAEIARLHGKTRTWSTNTLASSAPCGSAGDPTAASVLARPCRRTAREGRKADDRAASGGLSAPAPTPACRSYYDGRAAAACALGRDLD
jgi:hypothetical protein